MKKQSAGLLLYRRSKRGTEVFLVHPGGPFWAKKDAGAWSIPKGEYAEGEDALQAAIREFEEETGVRPEGEAVELGTIRQAGGKVVRAWAMEGDLDETKLVSHVCGIEWPPRSGKTMEIPEVDRGAWFAEEAARGKILKGQAPLLEIFFARRTDGVAPGPRHV